MSDSGKLQPNPNWGSEPIKGLNYDYLDIVKPPEKTPQPVMPEVRTEMNIQQAEDFYQRIRGKIVTWAEGAGAGKDITKYVLLVPDIMALLVRLMADPAVSAQLKTEIAAASAYIIFPVDLMPEAVLGPAGLIDDAIIGMMALNHVMKVMGSAGEDKLRAYWDGDDDLLEVMQSLLDKADQFVTGTVWTGIKKFMADAASSVQSAAQNVAQSTQKPTGPVIEGSYRPILPPNERGDTNNPPEDQSNIPPNERR